MSDIENNDLDGKRTVQDTSFEDSHVAKKPLTEDEPPVWAQALLAGQSNLVRQYNTIQGQLAQVNSSIGDIKVELRKQNDSIIALDSRVSANDDRLDDLQDQIKDLQLWNVQQQEDNDKLKGEVASVRGDLTEQIDRSLRDQLMICGLPKDSAKEKYWDDTITAVAEWLAANSSKPYKYWDKAIIRAHRGSFRPDKPGPTPIHCIFRWRVTEEVRDLFMKAKNRIGSVTIKDKFSASTQSRVNEALIYRRGLLNENSELKIKVSYPAKVMVKAKGESRYKFDKEF